MTRLTKEDELALIQRFQDGCKKAESELIEQYRFYVVKIASKYKSCIYPTLDDRIQEGMIGLLKALRMFDPKKGCRLTTYAGWWIQHHIERAMADTRHIVRIPVHHNSNKDLDHIRNTLSLDYKLIDGEEGNTFADTILSEEPLFTDCLDDPVQVELLEQVLNRLPLKQRKVLKERYGLNQSREHKSCREVGEVLGMTKANVSLLELKALRRLRLMKEFSKKSDSF